VASPVRRNGDDLQELARLLVLGTIGVTDIVEDMHFRIASGPAVLGEPFALPARVVTAITRLVGKTVDRVLGPLGPLLGESVPGPEREGIRAALNGVVGDWLALTNSPLAISMRLRCEGSGPKVVVLVHGSGANDRQWRWQGHDHGAALAHDNGWAPVYVHYNSGLPIAENGRLLAEQLEMVAEAEEIAIVGHSMGGLVARVACHVAEAEGRLWRKNLRSLVTLGTPHHGAPLERAGGLIDSILPITRYSAPLARLGKIRSAGITDLRHGVDLPVPAGVRCHAVAAAKDRLVPISSARGPFADAHCSTIPGIGHLDLLSSREVYETIRRALG
jgi:pimeloyl-ACP methyl ester carboxylesterase